MADTAKMTPSHRCNFACRIVARVNFTMTRGEVRVALAKLGFETTEENVQAFAAAWVGTIESAVYSTQEATWGGHEGMTARYLIEEGRLPLTREAFVSLYDRETRPDPELIGKYLVGGQPADAKGESAPGGQLDDREPETCRARRD